MSAQPPHHDYHPVPPQPAALRDGTCAHHPMPDLWAAPAFTPAQRVAITLCRTCPALQPCRAWSLSLRNVDDLATVLGGLTPRERRALRARLAASQRALDAVLAPPAAA